MATVKAGRNKTIDTPLSEGQIYLDRCIAVTQRQVDLGGVLDKTVIGDMLDVCSLLPPKSIDLIIAARERTWRKSKLEKWDGRYLVCYK